MVLLARCTAPPSKQLQNSLGKLRVFLFYFYLLKSGTKRGQRQSAEGSEPGEWGPQANRKCLKRSSRMPLAGQTLTTPSVGREQPA